MTIRSLIGAVLALGVLAAPGRAQSTTDMVVSSDAQLGALAAGLLPDLAQRAGMELKEPVRLELRSRDELVRYLESKLDEELPGPEARQRVEAYALLGLVPPDLDLRRLLLGLYTEQVAGFYEPDSTALFVMDDQPAEAMEALLVHELVHAVQDQSVDLDALTDAELGHDRATAAQAAIEGHATLVMLEYMTEQMTGAPVNLAEVPDFASQVRPALEGMTAQYPELARAPRVIREGLLFPYLEGAGYVQSLWVSGERVAPFGPHLPESTEQVMKPEGSTPPVDLDFSVPESAGRVLLQDVLGRFELGILLEDVLGMGKGALTDSWDGDRYALVEGANGDRGLVSCIVWDSSEARDLYLERVRRASARFGGEAKIEAIEVDGLHATLLKVGVVGEVSVSRRGDSGR
jgi:hypothetical protein